MLEQEQRIRRLRPDVLQHFYTTCITSMEEELRDFPEYDRRKHFMRYDLVSQIAIEHAPHGGTVVDVGSASGILLDRVHQARATRGIGLDLALHGLLARSRRPPAPLMIQAVVEDLPLRDNIADVAIFSEVIEHLIDPYVGMREVSRITRLGGVVILTTNNASEMPELSPFADPLTWLERMISYRWPAALAFRNLTWMDPINDPADPLPREAPTYAPHQHLAAAELRRFGTDAGLEVIASSTFEFPVPQAATTERLRRLIDWNPALGRAVVDTIERFCALAPGIRLLGTHNLLVLRKKAEPRPEPTAPWAPARLPERLQPSPGTPSSGMAALPSLLPGIDRR
jgi:SAM-dependent methyltransferase